MTQVDIANVTGWAVRGSNPGVAIFSAHDQNGSGSHSAFYTVGTRSLPGVNRPGRVVGHVM